MDKKHTKFITALADLYKVIFKSESTQEVDFLLESLHEKGEAIRKKFYDIHNWNIKQCQCTCENCGDDCNPFWKKESR